MPTDAVSRFLEALERSRLLDPDAMAKLTADLAAANPNTGEDVVAHVIEKRLLTRYQADELLAGRGEGCVVAGRYRVLEKLGEGGMGAVYRARDAKLDREVALKVLPPHAVADPDAVARFQREAKALAKVSHLHVIHAHDAGEDHGRHFLVMEYAEGVNLAGVLRERGRLAPGLAADYARQAALGLQHAHERGLVHRDVKPGNLLLTRDGVVKLLDLGLARFLQDQVGDAGLTREGAGMGTPDYMAPEQFRDAHRADGRADVYSLGCTLYHLLTGRVPFPGSSLREKCRAHEGQQPPSFAEVCPDAPAGLVLVIEKMMAKRPADRFQTAAEVTEALLPYVATSSASLPDLRTTVTFQRGQLTMKAIGGPARRAKRFVMGAVVTATLALAVLGVVWLLDRAAQPGDTGPLALTPGAKEKGPPAKPKVVTIPDGLTVAQDGTGQHRTITEALNRVKSGQTIRVLDDATYEEALTIDRPSRHAGITLEAMRGATIRAKSATNLITVAGVPRMTLRGFHLDAKGTRIALVFIQGFCPGMVLEELTLTSPSNTGTGVEFADSNPLDSAGAPMLVRDCKFRGLFVGVQVSGVTNDYKSFSLVARVVIRDNLLESCEFGIYHWGLTRRVHIVGNRIWAARNVGIQLEKLPPSTADILIANNTTFECKRAFRLWDTAGRGTGIRLCNNLFLASKEPDMVFFDSGDNPKYPRGAGDGESLHRVWQMDHNWREGRIPTGQSLVERSWIPPTTDDVRHDQIDGVERSPTNLELFLRPAKGSPLATKGADGDLPSYVGAVPPEGVARWDWQWTWDAHVNKLLTVSKEAKMGGRFRTVNAALAQVRPNMTIRVLDAETYREHVVINLPSRQAGLTLEAPHGATLEAPPEVRFLLEIQNVARVTVQHFRLRTEQSRGAVLAVSGPCPGLLLDRLDIDAGAADQLTNGIELGGNHLKDGDAPAVIQGCTLRRGAVGIGISGVVPGGWNPTTRLIVRNNALLNPGHKGIVVQGMVRDLHIVGNRIEGGRVSALQLQHLAPETKRILIANNTALDSNTAFMVWDTKAQGEDVEVCNNLILGAKQPDMVVVDSGGSPDLPRGPGDPTALLRAWRVHHNWREVEKPQGKGLLAQGWIPPGPTDKLLKNRFELLLPKGGDPFLRPAKGSPLASGGAGGDLPRYVGAVPPEGAGPWDWERTWKARTGKVADQGDR